MIGTEREERALQMGRMIVKYNLTLRQVARYFNTSESTVHYDVTKTLLYIAPGLHGMVRDILDMHKQEAHRRGGDATKAKYAAKRKK